MTQLPEGKTRLDLVREGLAETGLKKRGRLVVATDRLKEDPDNERHTFRNMEGLIASVRAVGLIEAITVTPLAGAGEEREAYQIVTGHRRYRAALAAGLKQVEVLIREPEDALLRRQKSIISNVQREDVGPVEMAEALQSLMDEDRRVRSQQDLCKLIGKDEPWVSGMLRILSLPADLQRRVGTSQLTVSYDSMIRIARLDDEPKQRELVDAVLSGATARDIRQRIDAFKGKPAASAPPAAPKPKRVYHTAHRLTVIVQSETQRLGDEQCVTALREALTQARRSRREAS